MRNGKYAAQDQVLYAVLDTVDRPMLISAYLELARRYANLLETYDELWEENNKRIKDVIKDATTASGKFKTTELKVENSVQK